MKIVFVRPPFEGMGIYKPPHLGIAVLSAFLKKKFESKVEIEFIDALLYEISEKDVVNKIIQSNANVVAFTVKTMQVEQTLNIIREIKKIGSFTIICGGNHVSVEPELFVENGSDFAIVGEGETAIAYIIECLLNNIEISKSIISNMDIPESQLDGMDKIEVNRDELVDAILPDWDIMEIEKYNENIHYDKGMMALPIMASRGCPYKCDFCSSFLTWGTKVRYRCPELVVNEIEKEIAKYKIRNFHFYDDNLLLNRSWMNEFLSIILKKNLKINWICLSRPEIISHNSDLLPLMKKAGCIGFELGFETSDEELYKTMNKKNQGSEFYKTFNLIVRHEFKVVEFLIMCFYEGETLETLYKTYEQLNYFCKKQGLTKIIYSRYFATPFLKTEFNHNIDKKGLTLYTGNRYKYAAFLNFVPFSFLNSNLKKFKVNANAYLAWKAFFKFDNVINVEEFNCIRGEVEDYFDQLFNCISDANGNVWDLCYEVRRKTKLYINEIAVVEYVCRMLEMLAKKGVIENKKEDIIL